MIKRDQLHLQGSSVNVIENWVEVSAMFFKNFFFNGFLFLSKKTAQIVTSAQKKRLKL